MQALQILLVWTMLGAYAIGFEFGSIRPEDRASGRESSGAGITARLILYGPIGWLLLAAVYILPKFVDSKVRV
jgi:hypothetical protein